MKGDLPCLARPRHQKYNRQGNSAEPICCYVQMQCGAGHWLTSERLGMLTQALFPNSTGIEEAQGRSARILGGQVRLQACALAYGDG